MKRHDSQRGWFAYELYKQMKKDKDIVLLCFDLGFGMFDSHFKDFPNRCFNSGASETAGMGIAVGLALEGKKVFCYSITNFLIYRPFEFMRNYIDYEKIPVCLVASGRDKDYLEDGITHWSEDVRDVLNCFKNIVQFWPETKEEIPEMIREMLSNNKPNFISLRR
jgi:transketolase